MAAQEDNKHSTILPVTSIFKQLQEMHCDADKVDKKTSLSNDLEKIASDKGFLISGNPASGNCMFYALCEQLQSVKGIKLSHTELRKTLVQFLTENSIQHDGTPLFNFVSGYPTWREYLTSMSKDGTWGDQLVLLAAANYYRTDIRVLSSLGREVLISPDRPVNTSPLVLGHIHEEHYVSLHPKHVMEQSTPTTGQTNAEFNRFLLDIADEITNDQLDKMKFLCEDDLPKGRLDSIENPREFLNFLRTRGKIEPGDVSYLVSLLEDTGNIQVANTVKELGPSDLPGSSCAGNLPCLATHFTGRQEVVEKIIQNLTRVANPSRMIIIISLPGMGKTEVAIRVSHELLLRDKKSVIFIEKKNKLTDACNQILRRLSGRHLSERHDLISIAKRRLKELREDTVIVLDNTEEIQGKEFDDFAEYVVKYAPKVQLILTSREDVGFTSPEIHKVSLKPLDPDSSARLLLRLLQESAGNSEEHVKKLGELCSGIPLLLVHFAWLLKDGFSPAVLIQELRDNPIGLVKTNAVGYYNALGQFLSKFTENVLGNLVRVSVLPSAFSGADIGFLFDDQLEEVTFIARMVKCSLLQKINNGKYILHPLVRDYCRAERRLLKMEAVGEEAQHKFNHRYLELLRRLSKNFISKDSALDAISVFRNQKANIMEALKNCLQDKSRADEKEFGIDVANSPEVLDFLAEVLSPPAECIKLYQKCCYIARDSGDQKILADSLNSLGFHGLCEVDHRRGDRGTLEMFQQAYDIRMTLPEEQQKCVTHSHTICKLGLCYSLQGEEEKGRKLIQEGIDLRKRLGVPLYVAAGYCDLGNTYRVCGDHQKAIDIWKEETLPVYKGELGDHPWTASILRYMAGSYKALADGTSEPGNVELAIMYSREALELRIKLLGFHQDTARSHVDLSDLLVIKKEFKEALDEIEKALKIQGGVLGEEHKSTNDTIGKKMKILSMLESARTFEHGETFRKDESRSDGEQMDTPLKSVSEKPLKNSTKEQEITAFEHKCAQYISDELSTGLKDKMGEQMDDQPNFKTVDAMRSSSDGGSRDPVRPSIPAYILARGEKAKEAYLRALETGKTTDKRVRIFLIGQDRVGKTSVQRSLKGEIFRKDEPSTDGVLMDTALKGVSEKPWKNSTEEQQITAFEHKCAQYISDELSAGLEDKMGEQMDDQPNFKTVDAMRSSSDGEFPDGNVLHELELLRDEAQDRMKVTKGAELVSIKQPKEEVEISEKPKTPEEVEIPEKVLRRTIENLSKDKGDETGGIWPVITDFAGQAIYRAIHPIFVSSEAIYVLMFDLTKDLSATAHCHMRIPGCGEVSIQAPDSSDTNLDHIMRWLDLVHSFKHSYNGQLPPVFLVGTHADLVQGDPSGKKDNLVDIICDTTKVFSDHIVETFTVDNTRAGRQHNEEDPEIVRLRKEILNVGDDMPHTKMEVPLKWLQVENKVYDLASRGENYLTRQDFKSNIYDDICPFEAEGDFEVLLLFLHDRGTVVYHGCANDPDSLVVLNPCWLVDVLCQIITVEKQQKETIRIRNLRKKLGEDGILAVELLDHTCESLEIITIKESLLTIMKKFNLLCEFNCKDGNSIYLVPCMLTSKPKDDLKLNISENQQLAPVFITFDTQYVPSGLFSRLIVLFVEFSSRRVNCDQPRLHANFARFFIGAVTGVEFVCYKRVIKVHIWDHVNSNSNPVENERDVCFQLLSFLKSGLEKLQGECHWLRAVTWDLCARCNLCPPQFVSETGECFRHGKKECPHDDCAHYVSLTRKPVCCALTKGRNCCPPKTWSQAMEEPTRHEQLGEGATPTAEAAALSLASTDGNFAAGTFDQLQKHGKIHCGKVEYHLHKHFNYMKGEVNVVGDKTTLNNPTPSQRALGEGPCSAPNRSITDGERLQLPAPSEDRL